MIPLLVFYLHVVALAAAFTRQWQEEGMSGGVLAASLVALIFFVGWGMTSFVLKLVMAKEGLGPAFDRDAASLALLTVCEGVIYYFYLKSESHRTRAEDPS